MVRQGSAKASFVGSIPTSASNKANLAGTSESLHIMQLRDKTKPSSS